MKLYKVYRVSERGRKTLINRHLVPSDIGYTISADLVGLIDKQHGVAFGKEITKLMKSDNQVSWEYYPEDIGLPTYEIVEEK